MAPGQVLDEMRAEAVGCTACALAGSGRPAVFGEGPGTARLMLVGEQPGDQEDLQGRPFVGPAGQVLDRALAAAGLDRRRLYLTNAVKHFKFEPRGKRRIHQKPDTGEVEKCRFWLLRELSALDPALVVALGATAAQALLGRPVTIGRERGVLRPYDRTRRLLITVHPSYLLRLPDPALQAVEHARFVADLKLAAAPPPAPARPAPSGQLDLF
jgi:DNA polymerase